MTDYYAKSGKPGSLTFALSSEMRVEFSSIEDGFLKLPDLSDNPDTLVAVNAGGTRQVGVTYLAAAEKGIVAAPAATIEAADRIPFIDNDDSNKLKYHTGVLPTALVPSFDLHDDVGTSATIADSDRILFSDEDVAGDPHRYTTFANFKAALNIPAAATPFDLHDNVTTSATIAGSDRILFSDEGVSGDPMRYTTFTNFKAALNIPAAATGFDLHDDVGTALTSLADTDRFVVSDESVSGDPNRYITGVNVASYVRGKIVAGDIPNLAASKITTGTMAAARLPTIAVAKGGTGATTAAGARTNLGITNTGGAFDLHDDVSTALTSLADTDRFVVSDESVSGDPNRYITGTNVASYVRGKIVAGDIPNLAASKINAGTFASARLPTATTSARGAVELATNTEARAATATARAVTPANLSPNEYALTDQANIAWNTASGPVARVTLGGNRTLATPTNARAGGVYALTVIQDGTGGRTLGFSNNYDFGEEGTPTLSSTGGERDIITFLYTNSRMNMVGFAKGF